jgi:ribosomal protein S18 acetylase RimI-like enzyme
MKAYLHLDPQSSPFRLMVSLAPPPRILAAAPENQEFAIAPLLLAFASDPAVRWMYPDAHQYRAAFPRLVRVFGGQAFALGTAYYVEGFHGTSLWLPPGIMPDEITLLSLLRDTVAPKRLEELLALFEQMAAWHPAKPHWYLPLVGVDPRQQRQGFGSALLAPMLAYLDCGEATAYLESTNPENIPFYERHGFSICGRIQAGSSPTLFAMVREPQ